MQFVIRVYGILVWNGSVLVAHETYRGMEMTKFPGGGLEFGEGTLDCLKREFIEEIGAEIIPGEHFYTTDYFQPSVFNPHHQIISVYYHVTCADPARLITGVNLPGNAEGDFLRFEWVGLNDIVPGMFTFPIDQLVARKLYDGNK